MTRKKDEKVIIGGEVEITVLDIGRNRVRLGITAPKNIKINTDRNLFSQFDVCSQAQTGGAKPTEKPSE